MNENATYSDFAKKVTSDSQKYYNSVFSSSSNIIQRFIAFLIFTQLLYLLLFIISKSFWWLEWYMASSLLLLVFFGMGVFFLFFFLFKNIRAKAVSFFISGIVYFALSLIIAGAIRVESFIDLLANINDITFLGGLAIWNLLYSTIILLIGTARTFILGFVYDYQNKKLNISANEKKK